MFRFIQLFLLAYFLTTATVSHAQRDTVFWFAAPDVSSGIGESPVKLRFQTYDQAATITVSQPANGAFVPMTLTMPAFSSDSIVSSMEFVFPPSNKRIFFPILFNASRTDFEI